MKARIKATGEIAEFSTGKNLQGETILLKVGTASIFSLNEIEPITDTDWQQVRIDAAVKLTCALSKKMLVAGYSEKQIVKQVVELADALVAELQKKGGEQ